jgi:hypothetical protein
MTDKDYIGRLENIVRQMLIPLKDIPFNLVIESLTGKRVIPFDLKESNDRELLDILRKVALAAGREINKYGIESRRPNEVGNYIEVFVTRALFQYSLEPNIPAGSSGKRKAMGYPDIIFFFKNKPYYLECKTYNLENISTTQRTFYFSPSDDFKVIYDTHHFVLSYEMFLDGRKGNMNIYRCKHYKILSLESLSLDVKYEFNSDNKRMYSGKNGAIILDEGDI